MVMALVRLFLSPQEALYRDIGKCSSFKARFNGIFLHNIIIYQPCATKSYMDMKYC